MMLRLASIGLSLTVATAALAHDFWLQPVAWRVDPLAALDLTLQVGHGAYRQRSPIPASRIVRFEAIAADGRRADLRGQLHMAGPNADATIAISRPGTWVLALETDDRAESHLPAIRFNDYLKVEGLTPASSLRAAQGRMDTDGSENYTRHAKALIQVGPVNPRSKDMVARPIGMALEIVPEISPFGLPPAAQLPVRIYYRGRLLAGALVKLTDLAHDTVPIEMHRSDVNGRAVFAIPGRGSWLLNVIWTRPQARGGLTDFETDFSSLSFGISG